MIKTALLIARATASCILEHVTEEFQILTQIAYDWIVVILA